jgi:two-component system, sensor histidine kinase and response regulator
MIATTTHNPRAEELFQQQQETIYRDTDKLFARLMLCQWLVAIGAAILIAPQTWNGDQSAIHIHVWAAIFLGGTLTLFPVWLTKFQCGAPITRHVIAVAQMLMSALLIAISGGRIETHFHVFGSLVILSFYRDWRVLIPATLVVGLDHFLRGIYWPYSVYGVLSASPFRSLEHAGWVAFEDAFLVISCLRSVREMRAIANHTAALEASERSFREIFEEAPIGIAVIDLNEKFQRANRALCTMLGYSELELQDRTPLELTHPDDLVESTRLVQSMLSGSVENGGEKRYLSKKGAVIWTMRTGCVIRDSTGNPRQFLIMIEDISERKRAEKELAESRRLLEAAHDANQLIMDNSQDVICTIDEQGRFLSVNAASEKLWGYSPSELIGRPHIDLVHPDDRDRTSAADGETRRDGALADFVNRYVRKDGSLVDVLWTAKWSQSDQIFFCVAHDITEIQRNERALREAKEEADRANRAKSEFLSRMSHELRTPLNAILGFGQLLERQSVNETQRSRIGHIMAGGRHLLDLINEVLDISRIESGRLQLSLEPVCVAEAVAEAVDLMRPLAEEQGIELTAAAQFIHVLADRQRFKQVLLNLVTNAIKYTGERGKISITVNRGPRHTIRLTVKDTGVGIAAEKLSRLFTPFDRLGAESSSIQGTGLGLALCRRLMEAMNGTITAASRLGEGSSFTIELPATASPLAHGVAGRRNVREETELSPAGRLTVLYIEDNLSNLALMEQLLEEYPGIELLSAKSGKAGLDLARKHNPAIILLDLHLPDLPGWEVLTELKADETTRHIPIIVVSADATPRQIERLRKAGASEYLTKPIDVSTFYRVLGETTSDQKECVLA